MSAFAFRALAAALATAALLCAPPAVFAQAPEADFDDGIERPAPPALDDLESDANDDGVPDGWYNLRDGKIMPEGGAVGPKYLKFQCDKPGRPARLSRAFGVNGKTHEAVIVGLWVRAQQIQTGERLGEEPGLMVDFLGPRLRQTSRGALGPWNARAMLHYGAGWCRVLKRIAVPPLTKDAILSVGLLGATGVLDVDGLSIELVPVGGEATTNLLKNPGFELGDPAPFGWQADNGARRVFAGDSANAALELNRAGSRAMTGVARAIDRFASLSLRVRAKGQGLRGAGGASAYFFFLDDNGRVLPGLETGVRALNWSGTFDWEESRAVVPVPAGATHAVLQFDKGDGLGSVRLDDAEVTASPDAEAGSWAPYHVAEAGENWLKVPPSAEIKAGSALDFSFLLEAPAGKLGAAGVKQGRLAFARGNRARFHGVQLLPPTAFLDNARADALADRLARSGVNLVRLGDLDTPLGPGRSLLDDTRDDTKGFDPEALARLDHLLAALKARGIYYALELQGGRRFRADDGVAMPGALGPGGGPAAIVDPTLAKLAVDSDRALLDHVNPETGLALKNDPALAWVTLAGEVSLFDLIDDPLGLPGDYAKNYKALAAKSTVGTGRHFWQTLEAAHWGGLAEALHKGGLKRPVAGVSHWRREHEFDEALAAPGLDLIDDRIYWAGPSWVAPSARSMLWSLDGGLLIDTARKRKADRPYALGQWCDYTQGAWASPFEAAEQLLAARMAASDDWDALVRRGLFVHPEPWGSAAPGTGGAEDIFQVPEVANAAPHVFALWPHAASLLLRGAAPPLDADKGRTAKGANRARRPAVPGWEPNRGRLVIDTPHTQGVAGWPGGESVTLADMTVEVESTYGVIVASSAGKEPLSKAKRVLVTAVARIAPTGLLWADDWRKETADPGRPPLLQEPVVGKVVWRRDGTAAVKAYALDNDGNRLHEVKVDKTADGAQLVIEGNLPSLHWELSAQ